MAIQSAFYFTDGATRTFPSTKHIASSSNVAVWMKRIVDDEWELTSHELWTLANNSIVFTVAPQSTVYSQIELRIADESDELTESPSNIALVAGSIANVDTVATNISAVNTVSTNITAVQNTSANATNINTVSTNIANVNAVGPDITKVNTVASNIANVNTVASDLLEPISEINTVATNIANVNTVGLAIASVNTVATSIANVNTVAGVSGNVTTVAGSIASVNTAAASIDNINTVASDLLEPTSEIDTVATNIANVNTVGTNITNVNTVAGISANVTTVASNTTNINNVVASIVPNLAEILLADTNATTATTKAAEASNSALSASNSAAEAAQIVTAPLLMSYGNLNSPLLDMPLKNSLAMKAGVGSATFTRASTATYIDRYGVLKTAAIDEPRFEKEGYLNEGASTNFLTYSDNMLNGYLYQRATLTLSTTELSPDGITYASELRETTAIGGSYVYKSHTFTAGTTYTHSIFAKSINGQNLLLYSFTTSTGFDKTYSAIFDLTNGTISGSGASNAKIVPLSNGWYRCSITATCTTTTTSNVQLANIGTNYESPDYGLYIFGAQLEALPFATSYIPTVASTVTRAGDVLSVTRNNNFPDMKNNILGFSAYVAFDTLGQTGTQELFIARYAASDAVGVYIQPGTLSLRTASTVNSVIVQNVIAVVANTNYRVTANFSNSLISTYINGILSDSDINTHGKLSDFANTISSVSIGSGLYGHISNLRIYDKALSSAEVALA